MCQLFATTFVHIETTSEVKNCPGAPGKLTYFACPQATRELIAEIAPTSQKIRPYLGRKRKEKKGREAEDIGKYFCWALISCPPATRERPKHVPPCPRNNRYASIPVQRTTLHCANMISYPPSGSMPVLNFSRPYFCPPLTHLEDGTSREVLGQDFDTSICCSLESFSLSRL